MIVKAVPALAPASISLFFLCCIKHSIKGNFIADGRDKKNECWIIAKQQRRDLQ